MTGLITAEEAIAALKAEILDHGFHEEGQLMRLTETIAAELAQANIALDSYRAASDGCAAELAQARADTKAAVAVVVEKAAVEVDLHYAAGDMGNPGHWVRAIAPEDAIAEVARMRKENERSAKLLAEVMRKAYDFASERDRLAADLAAANAREAEAVSEASIARALDAMEANMRRENQPTIAWRTEMPPEDQAKLRDCVRDGVRAALAQPSTGGAS